MGINNYLRLWEKICFFWRWFLFFALQCFGGWYLYTSGFLYLLLAYDITFIGISMLAVYIIASLWIGKITFNSQHGYIRSSRCPVYIHKVKDGKMEQIVIYGED